MGALRAWGQSPVGIDTFAPMYGSAGDRIQVYGNGFSSGTIRVFFWNGLEAAITITSDTILFAYVPNGASTGPLSIQRNSEPLVTTADDFTIVGAGPYIIDFAPTFGATNGLVLLRGVHFTGVAPNGVKFNGVSSTDASPNSAGTEISVHVPYGATSGRLSVTAGGLSFTNPNPFTVVGPGAYITGFSPDHGNAGTTVYIDGMHFTGATGVLFNGATGVNFIVQSDIRVRADAPTGVTTGPLTVRAPLGNSTTIASFFAVPSITSLVPPNGRANTNVIINGVNFRGTTAVTFNGRAATYTVLDNNRIQATVPVGTTTGLIRVTTPYYSSFSSNNFVILPTVYSFTPVLGPAGTSVTISGANLNLSPIVRFNGVQAAAPTSVTFSQLVAVVPAAATTGRISVTTTDGSHTNANLFYLPASISGFTPTNSPPGSRVRITGQNFVGAMAVSFNGVPAAFTVTNNTTLGATVPAGVGTGPMQVTTPAGTVTSAGVFYAAPLITSFTPTSGLPGTNVTITGVNFLGARAVRFNGQAAAIGSVNNTRIIATVPNNAQSGPITVEGPAGTNTSATPFVLNYASDIEVWGHASPSPVTVTSNLDYSITIVNRGPHDAPNVRLTNTLPGSVALKFVMGSGGWTVTTNAGQVILSIANLYSGGSGTLLMQVTPTSAGTLVDTTTSGSDRPDPYPGNNSLAIITTVEPLPQLSIRWMTNAVRVSWPQSLTNWLLQSTPMVNTNGSWLTVSNPPAYSGGMKYILDPTTNPARFYRLKK